MRTSKPLTQLLIRITIASGRHVLPSTLTTPRLPLALVFATHLLSCKCRDTAHVAKLRHSRSYSPSLGHTHTMSSEEPQPGPGQDASRVADQLDRLNMDGEGEVAPRTEEEYAESQLTLRAIVSSKEAGVIIGKAGKNVADLRDETGVRAGVSKVVQGVHDRVLSVTGSLSGISKAYGLVAKGLLEGAPAMGMGGVIRTDGTHRTYNCYTTTLFQRHGCA
jgi:hypothetical protein